jgi:GT2 family glycosyltransferase
MTLKLDIVIPTYNRPHLLPPLVTALAEQCGDGERIIIVRQGEEPSAATVSPARCIALSKPNLPAARNRGIAASQADVILFLDDDVTPAPDLVAHHRACYDDPSVAAVAGFVDDPLFVRDRPVPSFIDLTRGDCVQNFACVASQKTASAMGANMSFRKAALDAVGGFDEHYKRNALWEEVDCCMRLLAKGLTLRYCAEAKVLHHREDKGGCRGDRGKGRYLYHQFANTAYFASRFAKPEHYPQWFTFWKYRLEYFSRVDTGRDYFAVLAGVAGAVGGIARFFSASLLRNAGRNRIDKEKLSEILAVLGSKG